MMTYRVFAAALLLFAVAEASRAATSSKPIIHAATA